jgi:hypothetical protein
LIRVIVSKATLPKNANIGVIDFEVLEQLTNLTFSALTDLRHRGAFSAVAFAFEACCARYQKEERESILVDLYEVRLVIYADILQHSNFRREA